MRKGSLGVALYTNISDSLSKVLKLKNTNGALIKFIVPNSSAEKIGLKANDLITSINNVSINSGSDLIAFAQTLRAKDNIKAAVLRNNKSIALSGEIIEKPYETSSSIDITYGEFKYKDLYIRTIYKKSKTQKTIGTVYFIHGISCYSLDNMKANDPTRMAIEAMVNKGFAVYSVEKMGTGDSYSNKPCEQIGFDDELNVFKEGYKNLKKQNIDTNQIFIFGHSLGGISAPLIAQVFQPKGVVIYGCGLKPWCDYLLDATIIQSLYYGSDLASLRDTVEFIKPTLYEFFYNNKSIDELVKDKTKLRALELGIGYNSLTKLAIANRTPQFHKEINQYNLAKAWKNTQSYVLSIYGEADIAANNDLDHKEIVRYVNEVHPNKANYLFIPKTNHTFQEIGTMADYIKMQSNPIEYEKFASQHFNSKLFDTVCEWMTDKLNKKL